MAGSSQSCVCGAAWYVSRDLAKSGVVTRSSESPGRLLTTEGIAVEAVIEWTIRQQIKKDRQGLRYMLDGVNLIIRVGNVVMRAAGRLEIAIGVARIIVGIRVRIAMIQEEFHALDRD